MGKNDDIPNNASAPKDGTADRPAADTAGQVQLSFFETVAPAAMNTEKTDSDNAEQIQTTNDPGSEAVACASELPSEPLPAEHVEELSVSESLGQRLRAAREAQGMRCEDAAHRLRLPLATIQALEADRYDRIGQGIYLRGYLSKYLHLLDLPQVLAERVLTQNVELPPLITSGTVSRPRYLFQRYSVSALYLILTGVIIVPAVLLAMRAGFEPNLSQILPLDSPDTSVQVPLPAVTTGNEVSDAAGVPPATSAASPPAAAKSVDETPLVASLAPFPTIKRETGEGDTAEKVASAPASGQHSLRLTLVEPSWVEIVAADGEKIEYGLLPGGTVRSYNSNKSIDVRLGNVNRATVEIDGKQQDLTSFRHANVAHFKVADGEARLSPSGT